MKLAAVALVALVTTPLVGCTTTTGPHVSHRVEAHNKCLELGFTTGTDGFDKCYAELMEMSAPSPVMARASGGAPALMMPQVQFQPLPPPPQLGAQRMRVQANCTSYQMGMYTNTNCY